MSKTTESENRSFLIGNAISPNEVNRVAIREILLEQDSMIIGLNRTIKYQQDIIESLQLKLQSIEMMYREVSLNMNHQKLHHQEQELKAQLMMIKCDIKNNIDPSKKMYDLFKSQTERINHQAFRINRHSQMLKEQMDEVKLNSAIDRVMLYKRS